MLISPDQGETVWEGRERGRGIGATVQGARDGARDSHDGRFRAAWRRTHEYGVATHGVGQRLSLATLVRATARADARCEGSNVWGCEC